MDIGDDDQNYSEGIEVDNLHGYENGDVMGETLDSNLNRVDTRRRVKLFILNKQSEWEDKGTGHVTVGFIDHLHSSGLLVRSEDNGSILLESRIQSDHSYQKQDGTLILWLEESIERALSFQEKIGCDEVWHKIGEVQRRSPGIDEIPNMESFGDDDKMYADQTDLFAIELPLCTVENLSSIHELFSKYVSPVIKKDHLVNAIQNKDYINKLLEIFVSLEKSLEDNEDAMSDLNFLQSIIKNLFHMNKRSFLTILLADENIMNVIGCLEYDIKLSLKTVPHRKFLQQKSRFKDVIPITNSDLLSKIHLMYKMQYIQDVILPTPSMFEETMMNTLAQHVHFFKIAIIEMIEKEESFLIDIFGRIEEENIKDSSNETQILLDLATLLREVVSFAQSAQDQTWKNSFSQILWTNGLMKSLLILFSSDHDSILQASIDTLQNLTEFSGALVQQNITHYCTPQEEDEHILNLIINIILDKHKSELHASSFCLLKTLIDPETFSVEMKPLNRTNFLSNFYKCCMHHLIAPLLAVTADQQMDADSDTVETTEILGQIVQLLTFCVETHSYHSRVYIINKNLLSRAVVLLSSKFSHLVLATIKLIRRIIGIKEDGFMNYIIKHNILSPVGDLLGKTKKYNMINSACLELFNFILTDHNKTLIRYVVEKLPELKEITYVGIFKSIQVEYDKSMETKHSMSMSSNDKVLSWSLKDEQHQQDRDEEAWFDDDDDDPNNINNDDDHLSNHNPTSPISSQPEANDMDLRADYPLKSTPPMEDDITSPKAEVTPTFESIYDMEASENYPTVAAATSLVTTSQNTSPQPEIATETVSAINVRPKSLVEYDCESDEDSDLDDKNNSSTPQNSEALMENESDSGGSETSRAKSLTLSDNRSHSPNDDGTYFAKRPRLT